MVYQYRDRPDAEQPHARQVGESQSTRALQSPTLENALRTGPQIDELVERVCWLMRRDPMRERGREV
jgi:hypothetical protein